MQIEQLNDVGPKTAKLFHDLGIDTAEALLDYVPFRFDDLRSPTPSVQLGAAGGEENAVGRVVWLRERRVRDLEIVEARVRDDAGEFIAKWIGRRRYIVGRLHEGMRLFVRGRVERTPLGDPVMNVAQHAVLAQDEAYRGELVPVYRGSKELTTRKIAQVVKKNLTRLLALVNGDPVPPAVAQAEHFASLVDAYRSLHAPRTPEEAQHARERLIFGEFLTIAIAAQLRRRSRETERGAQVLAIPPALLDDFETALPFALTGAQRRAIGEIWRDMASDIPMNRLLQGDVGSGKTLVAAASVLLAARNGAQSALMAPTEILATQHAGKLAPLLLPFGIGVEVLVGSQSERARNAALDRLANGQALLAVGTHALITENVEFARLGLVVIDEQHRFGVEQRARLRAKGIAPHTLHMTATPIPRTLAQSLYADLDVSVIDELPPGRTPIVTFALREGAIDDVYEFARLNIRLGHQVYVVAPAIEESESEITSVVRVAETLKNEVFPDVRVGLLHGRLNAREKEAVMQKFVRGELDVLVATTVIEVGVDVPNASVMIVLDAHRYGLAQLHQLRGRVGRGAAQSYCILVAPAGDEAERLRILTESTDGFRIADEDLRLRGPGEFAGTAQSGGAELRFADLVRDFDIYRRAAQAASAIVATDPELTRAEHAALREQLASRPSTRALVLSS